MTLRDLLHKMVDSYQNINICNENGCPIQVIYPHQIAVFLGKADDALLDKTVSLIIPMLSGSIIINL